MRRAREAWQVDQACRVDVWSLFRQEDWAALGLLAALLLVAAAVLLERYRSLRPPHVPCAPTRPLRPRTSPAPPARPLRPRTFPAPPARPL